MPHVNLATIIINYNMEELTCSFVIEELSKCKLDNVVVIVDNGATEESSQKMSEILNAHIVREINADVDENCRYFIIFNKENTGFACGNNLGVEFVRRHFECQYLLFSNNDIRLKDSDVVEQLIAKLETLPDVGIIGPKVVGLDGHCQSPDVFYPFWTEVVGKRWGRFIPFYNKDRFVPDQAKKGRYYRVMGSFFLCRTIEFLRCGMMDNGTFLYMEEACLSDRMRTLGKGCYYNPSVCVEHHHGATVNRYHSKKDYLLESQLYYYRKYHGVSSFQISLARMLCSLYHILQGFKRAYWKTDMCILSAIRVIQRRK